MAVSNKAVFELRPATGNNLNGGGFITGASGTDFSQQTSPQATFNGTSVTATTAGVGATITITGYTVVAGDVGNLLRIASGTNYTAGLYQIASVNTGANTWTLDRNCTTGAGAAMVGRMGGCLATLEQFISDAGANAQPGGYICYAVGTETITSVIIWNTNFNTNANGGNTAVTCGGVQVNGYTTTRTDNGQFTITTATNSTPLVRHNGSTGGVTYYNVTFTTSAATVDNGITIQTSDAFATRLGFDNCLFDLLKQAVFCSDGNTQNDTTIHGLTMRNCEVKRSTTHGIVCASMTFLSDCYIHDNTGDGVHVNTSLLNIRGILIMNRVICYNNTGCGVQNTELANSLGSGGQMNYLTNCAMVSNGSDGFKSTISGNNGMPLLFLQNNIFYGNTGIGVNAAVLYVVGLGGYNAFGSNTGGARSTQWPTLTGDVALSGDPFTNKSGGDFSLNSTAGAGAACKQVGFPGVLRNGGTGFADIGPLSPQASAGSTTISVECNTSIILNRGGVAGY